MPTGTDMASRNAVALNMICCVVIVVKKLEMVEVAVAVELTALAPIFAASPAGAVMANSEASPAASSAVGATMPLRLSRSPSFFSARTLRFCSVLAGTPVL